jgi:tetratricopeptide (TPR) repeat protein
VVGDQVRGLRPDAHQDPRTERPASRLTLAAMTDPDDLDGLLDEIDDLRYGSGVGHEDLLAELEARANALQPGRVGRAEYWSAAAEACTMAGEHARALRFLEEAVADGGETTINAKAALIGALLEAEQHDRVDGLLAELLRDVRAGRATGVVHEYVAEELEHAGRLKEALQWFGISVKHLDDPDVVAILELEDLTLAEIGSLAGRARVRKTLGMVPDYLDDLSAEVRAAITAGVQQEDVQSSPSLVILYWPAAERTRLLERWPGLEEVGGSLEEHRARVEQVLRTHQGAGSQLRVVSGTLERLLVFAAGEDLDPAESRTRKAYAEQLADSGAGVSWPPGRNEPCWCGTRVKYKRCCGALSFPPTEGRLVNPNQVSFTS